MSAIITAGASSSAVFSKRVYRSTAAALLLRGAVLDIEERYRKKGFPTNDVSGKDCELPKVYARQFKCTYDLIGLNLDDGIIAEGAMDQPTWLFADLDPAHLDAVRATGAVFNHRDYPAAPPACRVAAFG